MTSSMNVGHKLIFHLIDQNSKLPTTFMDIFLLTNSKPIKKRKSVNIAIKPVVVRSLNNIKQQSHKTPIGHNKTGRKEKKNT